MMVSEGASSQEAECFIDQLGLDDAERIYDDDDLERAQRPSRSVPAGNGNSGESTVPGGSRRRHGWSDSTGRVTGWRPSHGHGLGGERAPGGRTEPCRIGIRSSFPPEDVLESVAVEVAGQRDIIGASFTGGAAETVNWPRVPVPYQTDSAAEPGAYQRMSARPSPSKSPTTSSRSRCHHGDERPAGSRTGRRRWTPRHCSDWSSWVGASRNAGRATCPRRSRSRRPRWPARGRRRCRSLAAARRTRHRPALAVVVGERHGGDLDHPHRGEPHLGGVHWFSDIVQGLLLGWLYLALIEQLFAHHHRTGRCALLLDLDHGVSVVGWTRS
jgi:hypothetical protein